MVQRQFCRISPLLGDPRTISNLTQNKFLISLFVLLLVFISWLSKARLSDRGRLVMRSRTNTMKAKRYVKALLLLLNLSSHVTIIFREHSQNYNDLASRVLFSAPLLDNVGSLSQRAPRWAHTQPSSTFEWEEYSLNEYFLSMWWMIIYLILACVGRSIGWVVLRYKGQRAKRTI